MEKGLARVSYDQSTEIMYILSKEEPSHEVVEAGSDVVLELCEGPDYGPRNMER